jgi:sigma-B regulation protein RsbU (phosphoserine phosphatase)
MSPGDSDKVFSVVIGNTIAEMQKVVDLVEGFGAHHLLPQKLLNELNVCLDELINNTISYGYDDQDRHNIAVKLEFTGGVLSAEICDDGRPFDPREAAPVIFDENVQSPPIGGLGLHFIKSLMDDISYARIVQKNVVKIAKKVHG